MIGLAVSGLLLVSCRSAGHPASGAPAPVAGGSSTTATTTAPAAPPAAPATSAVDPGLLAPSTQEPVDAAALTATMSRLWTAIVDGSVDEGLPLFFPRSAYLRLKTGVLADPAGDYARRLLGFYRLDLQAYHASLGPGVSSSSLLQVAVPDGAARYIAPGQCENLFGYWHLPGVRLVYQQGGQTRSFGVASLISWRGVWYVIHLGPNPRPSDVGTVDRPAVGPGTAGPLGGC